MTNLTPSRPNVSMIFKSQFSLVGGTTPTLYVYEKPKSMLSTPIFPGLIGYTSMSVPMVIDMPTVLGRPLLQENVGSACGSLGMFFSCQNACWKSLRSRLDP